MQKKCIFCGAELPVDARFCGNCGLLQDDTNTVNEATTRSNTPPPPLWYPSSAPGTPPPVRWDDRQAPTSAPSSPSPPGEQWAQPSQYSNREDQDEQGRRAVPPGIPFPGIPAGSGQPYAPGAPVVQGTPHISAVPAVPGAPTPAAGLAPAQPPSTAYGPPQGAPYPAPQPSFPQTAPHLEPRPREPQQPHMPKAHQALAAAPKAAGGIAAKWIVIAVAAVVVLGASGAGIAAYVLTRPQPVISITSDYKVGTTLAGAAGTVLHITGQKFSGNSTITFLLDGTPVPTNQQVSSDANGNLSVDLTITSGWPLGHHTLTAKDAGNYTTKSGVDVMIVPQGQAHTPGPFGAPPDDASFKVNVSIQAKIDQLGKPFTQQETEIVTGHPDPQGGTVCQPQDTGQPRVNTGVTLDTNQAFRETYVLTCTGSYKGGKLTFTETVTSDTIVFTSSNPVATCTLNGPHVDEQLSGSYTDQHMFSGTITYPEIPRSAYTCNQPGSYFFYYAGHGSWTGQITS